jgi:hypothetical protein
MSPKDATGATAAILDKVSAAAGCASFEEAERRLDELSTGAFSYLFPVAEPG